ncbi:mite allergen Lep d 7-like [Dermacentor andersoni]|uniref:mite allergen Lep d 7-like n=1 Tax=Dermacentor andersoni TaxID=34620 RepID=UPI0021558BF9|nr:mite allergen Der f 7-like [Dermacentor andersoni]
MRRTTAACSSSTVCKILRAMWKYTAMLLLWLLCLVAAAPAQNQTATEQHANEVFDQILESVSQSETLDPLHLPEQVASFDRTFLVRFHGETRLYNTTLTGLSTVQRTGNCRFQMDEKGLDVLADVGVGALDLDSKAHVKFMGRGPTVDLHVHIDYVRVLLEALQVDGVVQLRRFKVQELLGFTLKINGLGPLSYMFNFFSTYFTRLFKGIVRSRVEKVLSSQIERKIRELKLTF